VEEAAPVAVGENAPAPGLVPGPYTAETFTVTTEGSYLVVEIGG